MDITVAVRDLYEAFPYPAYPLLAKPRWQDGYLASSGFSQSLVKDLTGLVAESAQSPSRGERIQVLVAGSGEILPYILRRWEPAGRGILCLDLSGKSLKRARLRLLGRRGCDFVHGRLEDYLDYATCHGVTYEHIDTYGVLHHLEHPSRALEGLARLLVPGGTMRLMVYNGPARHWIHHVQRAFAVLGLDPFRSADRKAARGLLAALAEAAPRMKALLAPMKPTLSRDAGLVDTFFHAREVRWEPSVWLQKAKASGLVPMALFDRYGELDDLPNPLWNVPAPLELDLRSSDRRFENNLEMILVRPGGRPSSRMKTRRLPGILQWKSAPSPWFRYDETRKVGPAWRRFLWKAHLAHRSGRKGHVDRAALHLKPETLARLARLGAILPGQVQSLELKDLMNRPMAEGMEIPPKHDAVPLGGTAVDSLVKKFLARGESPSEAKRILCLSRLEKAQL